MPTPKKLPSGSWRIRLFLGEVNGKKTFKSITAPTRSECMKLSAEYQVINQGKLPTKITVRQAIDKYISLSETLSPTTLAGYEKIKKYAFSSIMDTPVDSLTDSMMQAAVNAEAKRKSIRNQTVLSAKTVKNEYGLLSSALSAEGREFKVRLPKYQRHIEDIPDPQDILKAIKGTDVELPCIMALWLSFTMSEVMGIKCSDIKDGYVTINRVMVKVNDKYIVKENAKTETRLRKHRIPSYITDLIEKQDTWKSYQRTGKDHFLILLTRDQIYGHWKKILKQNNIPSISFHKLRHENASIMSALIPEKYAMERGGWKTASVYKNVYSHTLSEQRVQADNTIDDYFKGLMKDL